MYSPISIEFFDKSYALSWPVLTLLTLIVIVVAAHFNIRVRQYLFDRIISYPRTVLTVVAIISAYFCFYLYQQPLQWETDARVYLPKGHAAITYDEKVDQIFGVKDTFIVAVVNEKKGIYNPETLTRIKRVTDKISQLPSVIIKRNSDVASLSTALVFAGSEDAFGSVPLMAAIPGTDKDMQRLKQTISDNADMFVGNIVSADGTAAMIRAKLKEGTNNRYMSYWQIKSILDAEQGKSSADNWQQWQKNQPNQGDWPKGSQQAGNQPENLAKSATNPWWPGEQNTQVKIPNASDNGDYFYMAGRPVIEVSSGLYAKEDVERMLPYLSLAILVALIVIFKSWRGVVIPVSVLLLTLLWTLGNMAEAKVPFFTISVMLPVILLAVGIANGIHLMGNYYDLVMRDPQGERRMIVKKLMEEMALPLMTACITTVAGFLSLWFADMPPFRIFGVFTALGILYSWFLSITFIPALLAILDPKVGAYLQKRRTLRLHDEEDLISRVLVASGRFVLQHRKSTLFMVLLLSVVSLFYALRLSVDSSWMGDFRKTSEVAVANKMINDKFSGTIFLSVVIESTRKEQFKDPVILKKMEAMQQYIEKLPFVGDSLSLVDYIKSMNKTLNADQIQFKNIPDTREQIGEFLFLFSISGRPEQLNELVDFDYQRTNMSFLIKTDRTKQLKTIIDAVTQYAQTHFNDPNVTVNLAGSANNSYVWAEMLISSQTTAIIFSKIAIFVIALVLMRSFVRALLVVIPITLTTLFVAGGAGALDIPLDVSTTLAAGIAIGVGVDYAIHYIFRFMYEFEQNPVVFSAAINSLRKAGRTIVFNAVVVSAGFLVLLLSQFPPHMKLGSFVAVYMVLSCLMALLLIPPALTLVYRDKSLSGVESKANVAVVN